LIPADASISAELSHSFACGFLRVVVRD